MNRGDARLRIQPFAIEVAEPTLTDLRARIGSTRWPDPARGPAWEQGTDLDFLQGIVAYWADGFDWRVQERWLNSFAHFRAQIDGVWIHFVHERAMGGQGIPLILTHGWPSSFVEYLPLAPLLTDPAAHGIDGPAFDVVIPSLPGYGFSERPAQANYRTVSSMWHRLMQGLGYERYGAGGGDFGAGVATVMAFDEPDRTLGIHLSNLELSPVLVQSSQPLSDAERSYLADRDAWDSRERGYSAIQSTKPQTLGYGLSDSPIGQAAWILEKWRSWADSGGDVEARFGRDFLLTIVTLYWVTGTMITSIRDYFDNRWRGVSIGPHDRIQVPTGIANFCRQFAFEGEPPREWAERLYNVRQWTPMPSGGHFASAEEPDLLARDIAAFFGSLGPRHHSPR
jgi:pimeloyl-ACP methyl ester carboxylesterase